MSNYEKFWAKILQRRQNANRNRLTNANQTAYLTSDLIKRMVGEVGYIPQSPETFRRSLSDRESSSSDNHAEKRRKADHLARRHAQLTQRAAEQQAIIDTADPLRTPVDVIADAQREVGAISVLLDRIPADALNFSGLSEVATSNEEYRAGKMETLKAWRERLRMECLRITTDINDLDPHSINLESYHNHHLLDELDFITRAIDDAGECLKIANYGQAVPEFSMAAVE